MGRVEADHGRRLSEMIEFGQALVGPGTSKSD